MVVTHAESKLHSLSSKLVKSCLFDDSSSQEPEVLLPPGADEVPAHALALLPHRQRQARSLVDALLHELLAAAPQEAT